MKTLVAFQFELQPHPGQTGPECLAVVRSQTAGWLDDYFRGAGAPDLQLTYDGSEIVPHAGHKVRAEERACDTHRLVTLEWEYSEPHESATVWQFSAEVACDARAVDVALVVRVGWQSFALRPLNVNLTNANPLSKVAALRDKLLLGWKARLAGQPIPTRPQLLRKSHVDAFVREVLLNPKRVLPVVLFSLSDRLNLNAESLQNLQTQVLGVGHLAALLDAPAAARLVKLVGPQVYCQEAVMRVYWPGLLQKGVPQNHPFQTLEQLQKNLKASPLPTMLMTMLAPASAEQFRAGRVSSAAAEALARARAEGRLIEPAAERLAAAEAELQRAGREQERLRQEAEASRRHVRVLLDDLADLRAQLAARPAAPARPDEQFAELAAELEQAWDENKRWRADWEAARRQLAELETDFRNYLDASAFVGGPPEPEGPAAADLPAAGGRSFATVADALRAAAEQFADVLVVWEDAERSAERSSFASPAKVFQALAAVAEVGRSYLAARNGGPPSGPLDRAFLSRVPFKYTCFESPTTLSLFGAERVFHHHGESRQMLRHLTLGGGTTNNCLQIYFDFDAPSRRVLIGHCGRHLPYASQRT
jgi:hypothetical protein